MIPRPVIIAAPANTENAKPIKRTLFRTALVVAMVGSVLVSSILLLQGGLALGHLQYFIDVGQHPLHITSALLVFLGLLTLSTFIILTISLMKMNRKLTIIAGGILVVCSVSLIAFSIWSFVTVTTGSLPASISNALTKELDQTQYTVATGNHLIVDNTNKMARLEKQHQCCGLNDPVEDYRSRQPSIFGAVSSPTTAASNKGSRTTSTQRNAPAHGASSPVLPISCCNEKYRSADNLCVDMFNNNSNPLSRYNTDGCYSVIAREKFERIQRQGFTTVVSAGLAMISTIALAAVIRLLGEGYQVAPLPRAS